MPFIGCGKLKNSPVSGLNQPEASNSPEVNSQLEASSEIDAKDLTKKESWKEWTYRQWKDNKWYWIGGAVVVVSAAVGLYSGYNELSYLKFTRDLNKYQDLQNAYNKSMDCVLNKEVFRGLFGCQFIQGITEMRIFWENTDKCGKLVAQKGFERIWHQVQKDNPRALTNSFLKVAIIQSGGILPN
jgi:hypothetical protein